MAKLKHKKLTIEDALVPVEEQPYEVPGNWCWTYLNNIAQWGSGGTPSRKHPGYYGGSIPWIKTGELEDDYLYDSEERITEEAVANSSAKIFPENSVLIAMYGATIGKTAILAIPATTNQACACARCYDFINNKYLFYYLRSQKDAFIRKGKGGAQPNISQDIIKNHSVPLPPLAEQQRIVEQIESLFSKLDEAKEKCEQTIESFELRKKALLHAAYTGELTKEWRNIHKTESSVWEHKKFSEICEIVRGGSPRPAGDPKYYNGDIPFMKVADITNNCGPYVTSVEHSIKEAGLKKTRMIEPNTLLLTNSGATLGVPAICAIKTTFNDGIAAFLGLDEDSLLFYYYFWISKTQELRSINMGAAQPNLNTGIIGNIEIDIPSKEEQREIVRILEHFFEKELRSRESVEQVLDYIETIKKSILAKAFRGELGTNDPKEEDSLGLLQQILEG